MKISKDLLIENEEGFELPEATYEQLGVVTSDKYAESLKQIEDISKERDTFKTKVETLTELYKETFNKAPVSAPKSDDPVDELKKAFKEAFN